MLKYRGYAQNPRLTGEKKMMGLLERTGSGMKELYSAFRFLMACVIIFGSGYFVAKPRNDADKMFAPFLCALAVYYLWRGRAPTNPSLPDSTTQ